MTVIAVIIGIVGAVAAFLLAYALVDRGGGEVLGTEWVAPGAGDTAGELWDAVVAGIVLREVSMDVRVDFLSRGWLTAGQRERRTRLRLVEGRGLVAFDVERVAAAVWEFDQEGVGDGQAD